MTAGTIEKVLCDVCREDTKSYNGYVSYFKEENHLCRSHYLKWCKHHKPYSDSHKQIKPCTKRWEEICKEEEWLFGIWLNKEKTAKKGVDVKGKEGK